MDSKQGPSMVFLERCRFLLPLVLALMPIESPLPVKLNRLGSTVVQRSSGASSAVSAMLLFPENIVRRPSDEGCRSADLSELDASVVHAASVATGGRSRLDSSWSGDTWTPWLSWQGRVEAVTRPRSGSSSSVFCSTCGKPKHDVASPPQDLIDLPKLSLGRTAWPMLSKFRWISSTISVTTSILSWGEDIVIGDDFDAVDNCEQGALFRFRSLAKPGVRRPMSGCCRRMRSLSLRGSMPRVSLEDFDS